MWRATLEVRSLLLAPYTDSRKCPLLCCRRPCGDSPGPGRVEGDTGGKLAPTVDGVPCSALDVHVKTPAGPERVEGHTGGGVTVTCLTVKGVEGDTRGKLTVTCSLH